MQKNNQKYDYESALSFVKERLDSTQEFTKTEIYEALKTSDKESGACAALNSLKTKCELMFGITFSGSGSGMNRVYTLVPKAIKKIERKPESVIKENGISALEKDNMKLFNENEKLKQDVETMKSRCEILEKKMSEYKSLIKTYHNLVMA